MATDIRQLLPTTVRAALLAGSAPSALNPYITASALSSFGFVPYTGATANVNLGAFSISATTAQVGAGTNSGRALEIFQDTANVKIGSLVGTPTAGGIYLNQSSPSISNYTLMDDTSSLYLNGRASNSIYIQVGATNIVRFGPSFQIHTPIASASGSFTTFTFTKPNNTTQTASANIQGWLFTTGSRQWATGNITTQQEILITSPTYSFTGASTITNAYTLFVESPTVGTNATITNRYAAGFSGGIEVTTGNSLFRGVVTISRGVDANVTNFSVSSGTANIGVFSLNTDQPNSRVLLTSRNSNTLNLGTQDTIRMSIDTSGNIICGVGAIATNATNGFLYVPTCAGVPTGIPTTVTGRVPIVADSTNNRLYIYSGGAWVALN